MPYSSNDRRFWGETDSQTLQNMVDAAAREGEATVVIPRRNERTGQEIYIIDRCVYLPSDICVLLDGCHLRLADGVRENIFRNSGFLDENNHDLAHEQHNIRLIGRGGALLDGGKPNGMTEQLRRDHPDLYPLMEVNILVALVNVRNFEIRGLSVRDSRYWAFNFTYCRWGLLSDLHFANFGTL